MSADPASILVSDTGSLPAGDDITGIGYSRVDSKLYIASQNEFTSEKLITVYKVAAHHNNEAFSYGRLQNIHLNPNGPVPYFIACSPTEHKAYVSMDDGSTMELNTFRDNIQPATRIPMLDSFNIVAFSPDGRTSYFPNYHEQVLYAVDEMSSEQPVPIPLSVTPTAVAVTRDGKFAFCGEAFGGEDMSPIARVDLAAQKEKDLVKDLNDFVLSFDVSSDNSKLFVSTINGIDVVDIAQNAKILTISRDGSALVGQIACSPTAPRACFVEGQGVQVVDTIKNQKRGLVPAGPSPLWVAFDEYGNAYVSSVDHSVTVILHSKIESM